MLDNKKIELKIYIGVTQKSRNAINNLEDYLIITFGGYTKYSTTGEWYDGSNVHSDNSVTLEIITTSIEIPYDFYDTVKYYLRFSQEKSILITQKELINSEFITIGSDN